MLTSNSVYRFSARLLVGSGMSFLLRVSAAPRWGGYLRLRLRGLLALGRWLKSVTQLLTASANVRPKR